MDKYKKAYKILNYVFYVNLACFGIALTGIEMTGGQSAVWTLVLIVTHLAYLYYLGVLIVGAKKSFIKWVGLTFIAGPLGTVVSYLFLKPVAIEQDWV